MWLVEFLRSFPQFFGANVGTGSHYTPRAANLTIHSALNHHHRNPTMPIPGVTILYGSETGNAQDYAHYLARKLRYYSLRPTLSSLDAYDLKRLITDTRFLVVVCLTTGQGELPRNAKKFMRFLLKKKLPADLLNHVQFTTFGLGDLLYPKFNYAIKKIHTRLAQLGCTELAPRSESDELAPEGVDGYYAEWEASLIAALRLAIPSATVIDDHVLLSPEYQVTVDTAGSDIPTGPELAMSRPAPLVRGKVVSNHRITAADHFQDVRHLVVETPDALDYRPGDTLALYPPNDERSVQLLLELQPQWLAIADKPLAVLTVEIEGGLIARDALTLRSLFTFHLDIMSIPQRSFFALLHHFVDASSEDGERERDKLYEFSQIEHSEDLYDYANRPRRLILETIMEFEHNLRIPVEYVLDLFPVIKVRLFLIASKPTPHSVELAIAVVEYKTILRRIRRGLCTRWIKQLLPGDNLVFSVHLLNLKFSTAEDRAPPVLMISPGTGVAPMKSLIHATAGLRELYLFSGCRDREKDFLFLSEWEKLQNAGTLTVFPAVSREEGYRYKYVQDYLFAEKAMVGRLMVAGAIVFVCGSSGKMPTQVRVTLVEILRDFVPDPEQYLLDMENQGRYIQETW